MQRQQEEQDAYSLPPHVVSHFDQFGEGIRSAAKTVGLNPDSVGYQACGLFFADVLEHMAIGLKESDEEGKETGAFYIEEVARRLRLIVLWGEERCRDQTCLDLR